MKLHDTFNTQHGMNLKMAGNHGAISNESKERNRQSHLGEKNNFYGKHHTKESKEKISRVHKGRKHTEEAKKKISESLKVHNSGKIKKPKIISKRPRKEGPRKKHIFTEQHRRNLSKAGKGRPVSEKTLMILKKNWQKGQIPPNKGKQMSENQKDKIRMSWIIRKEKLREKKEIFNSLSTEDQGIVKYILTIPKIFFKRRNKINVNK